MRTRFALFAAIISLQSGCVTTTPQTVKTMSSEYLCEMLGPGWVSTQVEQEVIRDELLARNMACDHGQLRTMERPDVAAGASQPMNAGKSVRYDCGTHSDGVLVQLPIAPLNAEVAEVTIVFHGEKMKATYIRDGLKQLWLLTDVIYIELKPTMTALYWDFTGAEEGETRKPEAVFTTCKKRR